MYETASVSAFQANGESSLSHEHAPVQPEDQHEQSQVTLAFQRLSSPCKPVFELAKHEAAARGSSHIHAEHLLLGLMACGDTAAGRVLASLSVTIDDVQTRLGFVQGSPAGQPAHNGSLPLSPRVERVVVSAIKECDKRGSTQIGTLHLLAALVAERAGVALFVLEDPGIGLDRLGTALQKAFRDKWED